MSKKLDNVLDKVSERNNEYRAELRTLNSLVDEKVTSMIGEIVTLSNYTIDFSNAISSAKDMLVSPILRVVENYVIRDLRSVESVNEQFIDKINDKLDNTDLKSDEECQKFINNLNNLLNDKYLQIVKIKRVDFFNELGNNSEIENIISDFINSIGSTEKFNDEKLINLLNSFKEELYKLTKETLTKISSLYLDNFVNEVSNSLNEVLNYNPKEEKIDNDAYKPFIPDINPVPEIDISSLSNESDISSDLNTFNNDSFDIPELPKIPDISGIPEVPSESNELNNVDDISPMDIKPIAPIEVVEENKEEPKHETKHSYDVEEILKIAKSPVVTIPEENSVNNEQLSDRKFGGSILDEDFNEKEIVEEMIRRLNNRLEMINQRQAKLDDEKEKLDADEKFVNDLINSSTEKKKELDEFEASLDEKEKELNDKKESLDKKIKNVLPFANAVLSNDEESR